jgi:hypothetical protein
MKGNYTMAEGGYQINAIRQICGTPVFRHQMAARASVFDALWNIVKNTDTDG